MKRHAMIFVMVFAFGALPASRLLADAAADYKAKCAICHAADGAGDTPMGKKLGLKSLQSPEVQKLTDAQLYELIAKGKGKMPGFEKKLSPDEIKSLVVLIRSFAKK